MATYGMPHLHVDEPKDVPPMVERLRLELNRTVRRRVTEAVDAVCASFEDDLIELTSAAAPSQAMGVESFAVFRDCCSRLAHFIERNMNTTPGFLDQMDRIILACHCGTSGPELLSVVTKDLYICREDKRVGRKGRRKPVGVNTKTSMLGDFEQPAISPGNAAIPRNGEESSDEEATTGMTRKLRKRKKLTTSGGSKSIRLLTKRQKRSLITEWRRCSDESEEEKKAEESGDEERAKGLGGISLREKRAAELTSRRVKCIHRMEKELGSTEENEQETVVKAGKNLQGGTAVECGDETERGRRTRWNLRSKVKSTKRPSGTNTEEGSPTGMRLRYKTRAQMRKGSPRRKRTNTTVMAKEVDVVGVDDEPAYVKAAASASMPERNHKTTTSSSLEQHARETEQNPDAEKASYDLPLDKENGEMRGACDATDSGDGSEANAEAKEAGDEIGENVAMLDVDTTDQEAVSASVSEEPETSDGASPIHHGGKAADDMEMVHCRDASDNSPSASRASENQNDRNLPARTDIQTVEESSTEPVQNEGEEDAIVEDIDEDGSLQHDHGSSVPGLCDAGMRPPQQVSHFKACLRRSIQFVDAVLCKPPPGKTCTRNCVKVRERQCSGKAGPGTGIRCQDRLCRNWHETEAHTERCKNPLCEFGNRILLREMRHQLANQSLKTQSLLLEWEEKAMEQIAATTTNGTGEQYTPVQLTQLRTDIEKLEQDIAEAKEETEALKTSKRVLVANLSAIGVKPQDDERDGFPDFETHYK